MRVPAPSKGANKPDPGPGFRPLACLKGKNSPENSGSSPPLLEVGGGFERGRDPSPRPRISEGGGRVSPVFSNNCEKVVTIVVPEFAYNKLNPNNRKHELKLHNKK